VSVNQTINTIMNIIALESSNFAIASDCLSAAFSQDPLMGSFLPEDSSAKRRALNHGSQAFLNYAKSYQHIYTTAEQLKGVAIWLPPEASQMNFSQLLPLITSGLLTIPFYMRWTRMLDYLRLMGQTLELHEKMAPEPHWYLAMLGVSPEYQGQGIGGMLIQPVLQIADRTQTPCYLETSTPGAVRFYERNGFEVVYQGSFGDRQYWSMKRQPKH